MRGSLSSLVYYERGDFSPVGATSSRGAGGDFFPPPWEFSLYSVGAILLRAQTQVSFQSFDTWSHRPFFGSSRLGDRPQLFGF